jgi:hypothetical protein
MARPEARRSSFSLHNLTTNSNEPQALLVNLPTLWKAMIITSFLINIVLIAVVLFLVGFFFQWRTELDQTVVKGLARENIVELRDVVQQLQTAHIKTMIPIDEPLPIELNVPINQATLVTTTQEVPISVPASIDMGPFGQLYPNVNLSLPAGTPLLIQLKLDVPLTATIPVKLNVPVDIPLAETELAPQFSRLGAVVDNLVGPIAPLLDIDMDQPEAVKPEDPPATP